MQSSRWQKKSYALMLGVPSFVVASPEGLHLYSLQMNSEELVGRLDVEDKSEEEGFRNAMLRLQQR